jgi:hypothetical protein
MYGDVDHYETDLNTGRLTFPYIIHCKVPALMGDASVFLPVHTDHNSHYGASCQLPAINARVRIKIFDGNLGHAYLDGVIDNENPIIEEIVNRSPGDVSIVNVTNNGSYDAVDQELGYKESVMVGEYVESVSVQNGPTPKINNIYANNVKQRGTKFFADDTLTTRFERIIDVNGTEVYVSKDRVRLSIGENMLEITNNKTTVTCGASSIIMDNEGIQFKADSLKMMGDVKIDGGLSMPGFTFPDPRIDSNKNAPLVITRPVSLNSCSQIEDLRNAYETHAHEFRGVVPRTMAPMIIAPPVGPCTFVMELGVNGITEVPDTIPSGANESNNIRSNIEIDRQNMDNTQRSVERLNQDIKMAEEEQEEFDRQMAESDEQLRRLQLRLSQT